MSVKELKRARDERGFSLVEILISLLIFSVALLGLCAAGSVAARQVYMGRQDMARWSAVQEQIESLMSQGYDGVTSSTATVQGYPMTWTVSGTDPKRIELTLERANYLGQTVQDTFVTFLADPR